MNTCTFPVFAEVCHTLHHIRISSCGSTREALVRDVSNLYYGEELIRCMHTANMIML